MRAFLEEYGIAVFVIAVVAILILIATPVGDAIETAFTALIVAFKSQAEAHVKTMAPSFVN